MTTPTPNPLQTKTVGVELTPEATEAAARALAHTFGADDCFERVDEWEALEDWEREAHPDERPGFDYEDCSNYRRSATAALTAAYPIMAAEVLRDTAKDFAEGEWVDALMEAENDVETVVAVDEWLNHRAATIESEATP